MPVRIAKFEKIEKPQAHIFFAVQKEEETRALLLQAYIDLDDTTRTIDDTGLCDLAWEQVKDRAEAYLSNQEADTSAPHPLTNTEFVPKQ